MNDYVLNRTKHVIELNYDYFQKNFGIGFDKINFEKKKYFFQICTEMYNFRLVEQEKDEVDENDPQNEGQVIRRIHVTFILKSSDFTVGAFKREYTGSHYRWPLTLSVVCLNEIPYGIKLAFFDIARCRESSLYLAIYARKTPP